MPYIKQEDRQRATTSPVTAGELNFAFTELVKTYMKARGPNYQIINDIVGALEGAKLEFYRRIVIPYEDKKIIEKGDVYDGLPG